MKISEVIDNLEKYLKEHGDIEVISSSFGYADHIDFDREDTIKYIKPNSISSNSDARWSETQRYGYDKVLVISAY